MKRTRSILWLVLGAAGCGPEGPGAPAVATIDTLTNGVVRVTNTGEPTWRPEGAWRLEEDLRLGGLGEGPDDPEQFGSVGAIAVDSRNRIHVLDGQDQEVRVFEADGTFSHSFGRQGSGPGEFGFAGSIVIVRGDSVVVRDDGEMRYSVFGPDGGFVRSHRRDIVGTNPGISPGVDSSGRYVDWAPTSPEGRFGARFQLLPIRYSLDFTRADSLPPIRHVWGVLPNGMPNTYYTGRPVGTVDARGGVWFAESSTYEISRRTLEGDTVLTFSLPASAVPVGEAERSQIRDRFDHLPEFRDQILDALPEHQPVIRLIVADNAGHVLVFPQVAGEESGVAIDVFREDGIYLGPIRDSSRTTPRLDRDGIVRASGTHLYLVSTDDIGVPYVVRFRIVKPD